MTKTATVVIIGGGIQGLSLAYHLAKKGLNDVCLLEKATIGSGSSGKSAAIIGLGFQSEECLPLTIASLQAFIQFEDQLKTSPGFELIGSLLLARPHSMGWLRRRLAILEAEGIQVAQISLDNVLHLAPGMNLDKIDSALHLPQEGVIDPHSIMMAYASQARRLGVQICEGVQARGLALRSGLVQAVYTLDGPIYCKWVVNAAGAHAPEVARWAEHELPITLIKRHIAVTGPVSSVVHPVPFTYEIDPTWYMRREGPGLLLGMGSAEIEAADERVNPAFIERLIDYSIYRLPSLEDAGLMTSWAGLRPATPDDAPILGPVPHLEGYLNDNGWGGHGVMHAPAAGQALAEHIIDGHTSKIDLEPYRLERFSPQLP